MRFLDVGNYNDLGAMCHGLSQRGYEMRVCVKDPGCEDVFDGMLERVPDWRTALTAQGRLSGHWWQRDGNKPEADRSFGQDMLRSIGLHTAANHHFTDYSAAIDLNGANTPRTRNYIGEMDDSADILALLTMYRDHAPDHAVPDFVLM